MFDDDYSIELPIYTLRCRNVIVADLPDAPLFYASNMGPMITIVTAVINNLVKIGFIESYPVQVESLLSCLLHLLQTHKNDTAVATTISSIIQRHPDIKLRNP
ncbi:hypothetical protein EDC94DRAFT_689801 [Helicostylum pulchrum]|nr:hypothetical protein EDC94DRAFT_689801 [Helicostylum pulchrum]